MPVGVAPKNKTFTYVQLENLWENAGGSKRLAPVMAAIAMAESGGHTLATHTDSDGSTDQGLWQINTVHQKMYKGKNIYDPQTNAHVAVQIEKTSGLHAWSTFNNGKYKLYLGGKKPGGGGFLDYKGITSAVVHPERSLQQAASGTEKAVVGPLESIGMKIVFAFLIMGGVGLMLVGLALVGVDLGLSTKVGQTGASILGNVTPTGRAAKAAKKATAARNTELQGHKVALAGAKVKTEQARATELRTRTKHRAAIAKQSKAATERTARENYMKGAADTASPTMAAIRKKRGNRKST